MALPATFVWEVRQSATGSMVNGGGFNAARGGTDYTLQDAAQVSGTDGTSNASTNFASASATFTSAMVGNCLHLVSGTNGTAGWYEITAYVDANNVTLDRNCSTGAMTNGVFYVGGALSLNSTLDDDWAEILLASHVVYVKYSATAISLGESISVVAAPTGTAANPIKWVGYDSNRNVTNTDANRPTIACAASTFTTGTSWVLRNLILTGTSVFVCMLGANSKAINCKATNSSTTANRHSFSSSTDGLLIGCEAVSYRGNGVFINTNTCCATYGCYIHDCDVGIKVSAAGTQGTSVTDSLIVGCVTAAIQFTAAMSRHVPIINNTLIGWVNTPRGTGVLMAAGCTLIVVQNNIIYGFAVGVDHADTQTAGYDNFNDYYNNTVDVSSAAEWQKGPEDIALDPSFSSLAETNASGTVTAGASDNIITDSTQNFTTAGIVAGRDFFYLISGTNCTAGIYGITNVGTTTLTLDLDPTSSSTGSSIVYAILSGRNFAVGTNLKAAGSPGAFPGGLTTGYLDIGAAQRQEAGTGGGGGSYVFIG